MSLVQFVAASIVAGLAVNLYSPVTHKVRILGLRDNTVYPNIHGERLVKIPNTLHCEDLHHHLSSNLLFTACEDESVGPSGRNHWFPPLEHLNWTHATGRGSLVVVDPTTMKSKNLELVGFRGSFITHGIDIYEDPNDPKKITIIAVNHLPHPRADLPKLKMKMRSQIEIFEHTIGTSQAKWLRSVWHPKILTPNDIYATGPDSFYVTNDHYFPTGTMRLIEDLGWRDVAGWSNTLHVAFTRNPSSPHPGTEVEVVVALNGLHNNNGLGRGAFPGEVLVGSAGSGELTRCSVSTTAKDATLKVLEHLRIDSCIDNPSYYHDEYATPGKDASGYIIAGVSHPLKMFEEAKKADGEIPSLVWHVSLNETYMAGKQRRENEGWDRKIIFRDDGKTSSGLATAVLVGLDPAKNGGKKQGWLFVTGFLSKSIVASLIDL